MANLLVSSYLLLFSVLHVTEAIKPTAGHLAKTLVLGLGSNGFDVYSDIGTGLSHLQMKNVNRTFQINETIPDNCFNFNETTFSNVTSCFNGNCETTDSHTNNSQIICHESDPIWAAITFGFIQLPSLVIFICLSVGLLCMNCSVKPLQCKNCFMAIPLLLILVIPFPLLVFLQQIVSIFDQSEQMQFYSSACLFGEGGLEASPQLLLLLYIIMVDPDTEREIPWIQRASIVSSVITITKTSIELFCGQSYMSPNMSDKEWSYNDSLLKENNLLRKLWIMVKISPAFVTSLVYKVSSLAIITALLKQYALVYIGFGVVLTFVVTYMRERERERVTYIKAFPDGLMIGVFYALTNTTITSKCPYRDRKENYPYMMGVTITWVILHTIALTTLMVLVSLPPSYHLMSHWANTNRLGLIADLPTFYGICVAIILLGPISILTLVWLKKQVIDMEVEGGRTFWDVEGASDRKINEGMGGLLTALAAGKTVEVN